jgi:hypothetical protein
VKTDSGRWYFILGGWAGGTVLGWLFLVANGDPGAWHLPTMVLSALITLSVVVALFVLLHRWSRRRREVRR